MLLSIEETDTGFRLDLPDGSQLEIAGDDDAEKNLGHALISSLAKPMPAKLTLPAQAGGSQGAPADGDPPRFDLRGAKSLSDLQGSISSYLHDNAVSLGRKGLGKLQKACTDTSFRGKRYAS